MAKRKKRVFYIVLKLARIKRGISVLEAAKIVGKTPVQLLRMEEGELSMPRAVAKKLYDYYGLDPARRDEIVFGRFVLPDGRILYA